MNSLGMDYAYNQRDPSRRLKGIAIVIGVHALLGYVLISGMARSGLSLVKKTMEAVVVQEVIVPPPPPPPPPKPVEKVIDAPKVDAPPPPFVPPPDVAPPPTSTAPTIAATAAPPPVPAVVTPPPPAAPDAKAIAASMELEWFIKVRSMLDAAKRYPTGRKASQDRPSGKVKVWFIVARNGALVDAGILQSSDNNMLDDAALATLRRGVYPPFPPNTWVGQEQHKFQTEFEFLPPN